MAGAVSFFGLVSILGLTACAYTQRSAPAQAAALEAAGDASNGKTLFAELGCVLCHSVNSAGGRAAPPLDGAGLAAGGARIDPVDFAARIWRGAPAMVELQSMELGYVIALDGSDIRDLAAFLADPALQAEFTEKSIPARLKDALLDESFWGEENWDAFLRSGQEGYGEPPMPDDTVPEGAKPDDETDGR